MRWATWQRILTILLVLIPAQVAAQDYEILGVRYGALEDFPLASLIPGSPEGEVIDVAMALWVVRDAERTILVDTGFFRPEWLDRFNIRGFVNPVEALARVGIAPEQVTDVIITHAHWDHMGGIALFPEATLWIQEAEYNYYVGPAWQPRGQSGGIDPADIHHLVERNTAGSVRLVQGDSVEVLPGIVLFTGARHTYASQYVMVDGDPRFVLASDNAYLYRNLSEGLPSATFSPEDREANRNAGRRMVELAGGIEFVIPGHDAEQFTRFPVIADGVVRIRARGLLPGR